MELLWFMGVYTAPKQKFYLYGRNEIVTDKLVLISKNSVNQISDRSVILLLKIHSFSKTTSDKNFQMLFWEFRTQKRSDKHDIQNKHDKQSIC